MKKTFTLIALFALVTTSVFANNYTLSWAHTLDGNTAAADNAVEVSKSADGHILVLNSWGSASYRPSYTGAPAESMHFYVDGVQAKDDRGNEIIGSDYKASDGTSMNNNIALQKMDPVTGQIKWIVYTDRGDVFHNYAHVQPAKDGGAFLLLYVRHWAEDKMTILSRIHGTNGTVATLETQQGIYQITKNKATSTHIYYVPVLAKIAANGEVKWAKVLWDVTPHTDLQRAPSWLSLTNGFAVDNDENLYIAGNFRATLTFTKKDGTQESMAPQSIAGWDGDVQKQVGDLFLVKFDKDGNYLAGITQAGTVDYAGFYLLTAKDNKIYAAGYARSKGTPFKLGSFDMNVSKDKFCFIVAGFNKDLTPFFATSYNANNQVRALQLNGLQSIDNALYLTGSASVNELGGAWSDEAGNPVLTPTLEKNYQGYALKINPNDGAVLASGVNTQTTSISKFTGVYLAKDENNQQTIHAFGYDMGPGAIDFVLEENAATKTLANTGHSVVMNSVSVATTPVAFDGRVVFFNRFGQALTAGFKATYMDGTETTPVNCWSAAVYSYTGNGIISTGEPFGDVPTEIKGNILKYAAIGKIYNLNGTCVGTSAENLPKGIYIRDGKKFVVK